MWQPPRFLRLLPTNVGIPSNSFYFLKLSYQFAYLFLFPSWPLWCFCYAAVWASGFLSHPFCRGNSMPSVFAKELPSLFFLEFSSLIFLFSSLESCLLERQFPFFSTLKHLKLYMWFHPCPFPVPVSDIYFFIFSQRGTFFGYFLSTVVSPSFLILVFLPSLPPLISAAYLSSLVLNHRMSHSAGACLLFLFFFFFHLLNKISSYKGKFC